MHWDYTRPVSEEVVRRVETRLGVKFPASYVECVKKYNNGVPQAYLYYMGNGRERVFGQLIDIRDSLDVYETLIEEHNGPEHVIPFAEDPAGNFICFDYRGISDGEEPSIVFFDHEVEGGAIQKICDSFSDLLDMLHEPSD